MTSNRLDSRLRKFTLTGGSRRTRKMEEDMFSRTKKWDTHQLDYAIACKLLFFNVYWDASTSIFQRVERRKYFKRIEYLRNVQFLLLLRTVYDRIYFLLQTQTFPKLVLSFFRDIVKLSVCSTMSKFELVYLSTWVTV